MPLRNQLAIFMSTNPAISDHKAIHFKLSLTKPERTWKTIIWTLEICALKPNPIGYHPISYNNNVNVLGELPPIPRTLLNHQHPGIILTFIWKTEREDREKAWTFSFSWRPLLDYMMNNVIKLNTCFLPLISHINSP